MLKFIEPKGGGEPVRVAIESPLGIVVVGGTADAIDEVILRASASDSAGCGSPDTLPGGHAVREAADQLAKYFAGDRDDFELPLALEGTPFQRRVWEELCRIPHGETISYAELARRVGKPGASRAVGSANGRNPIPVIVPCHRVITSDGKLGGFRGGLDLKTWLLAHESSGSGDLFDVASASDLAASAR